MNYSIQNLENIIKESVMALLKEQPRLFKSDDDINERAVSGELTSKISKYVKGYHINCEYNRMTDEHGNQIPKRIGLIPNEKNKSLVYPDIIIHRQEDGDHNLLIIELKLAWKNQGKKKDIKKLNCYINELNYKYGLYLELYEEGINEMRWFQETNENNT